MIPRKGVPELVMVYGQTQRQRSAPRSNQATAGRRLMPFAGLGPGSSGALSPLDNSRAGDDRVGGA
jgi:hypothetical protein